MEVNPKPSIPDEFAITYGTQIEVDQLPGVDDLLAAPASHVPNLEVDPTLTTKVIMRSKLMSLRLRWSSMTLLDKT